MKRFMANRFLKCVLPILLIALLVSAASAAPIGLDPGKWAPATYQRLVAFVEANGSASPNYDPAKPPYAVFDWDQTCIFNDTEEELFRYKIETLNFKMTPEVFAEAIRKDIPKDDFAVKNVDGKAVNIDLIGADLDAAYTFLYKNYEGFGAGGKMTLEEARATEEFVDFRGKLAWLYEAIGETFSADVSYPWVLYLFSGMTVDEVQALTEKSNDVGLAAKLETYTLTSSKTLQTKAGVVSGSYKRGLRTVPEMSNLMNVLRSNGIHVYVCTASLDNVVRVFSNLPKYGYNVPQENVLGMRVAKVDGKYVPRYDDTWVQTQQAGKTEAIKRELASKYGYGPIAVFGDSQGDYRMCVDFEETQVVLVVNRLRKDDFGKLGLQAMETHGKPDAKFILQGRDENIGAFRPDEKTIKYGKTEPELFHASLVK